jgi:electron transfer flavoprotein alpha subunit
MAGILVLLQQEQGELSKASLSATTAATTLKSAWGKDGLVGICAGPGAESAAESALQYGFGTVYFSEDAAVEKYLAAPCAALVVQAAKEGGCDTVVGASTTTGKDLLPRVTAMLDAGQASDIIGVNDDGSLKRPMYAGDVIADVEVLGDRRVVTVRPTAFAPAEPGSAAGEKKALSFSSDIENPGEVIEYSTSSSERPELADAEVVVSGGRALQSEENFEKYIFPLADAFGAAVGASRAAVDSGYAPNDWQVGQTGKVVAPNLYIAVGISGAIQHLAGMKDSKVIVAINKDPDAPIYEIADFGLVADLYEVVPELTEAVQKVRSAG